MTNVYFLLWHFRGKSEGTGTKSPKKTKTKEEIKKKLLSMRINKKNRT